VTPFVDVAVVVFVALVPAMLIVASVMAVPPYVEVAIVVIVTSVSAMTPSAEVAIVAVITFVEVVVVVVVSQLL
jgi:hypothetical protein